MNPVIDPRLLFTYQENLVGIPLTGISGTIYPPTIQQMSFASTVTPVQMTQCLADAQIFNWKEQIQLAAPPTITPGPNAGTNPTITVNGTVSNFQVVLITGTKPTVGSLFTVTFTNYYLLPGPLGPYVFSAGDNNSAIVISVLPLWVTQNSTGFVFNSGSGKLSANTSYTFNFISLVL